MAFLPHRRTRHEINRRRSGRISTSFLFRTVRIWEAVWPITVLDSTARSRNTSLRVASIITGAIAINLLRVTPLTMRISNCRQTSRSFRARFASRNQFFTGEHRFIQSPRTIHTTRFQLQLARAWVRKLSPTRRKHLAPFIPGRRVSRQHRYRRHSALWSANFGQRETDAECFRLRTWRGPYARPSYH